jgi:hypothetical protein
VGTTPARSESIGMTAERIGCGCAIAALVVLLGFAGLMVYVDQCTWIGEWNRNNEPFFVEPDGSGNMFGDPCRDETTMPGQIGVATDPSVLLGWQGYCPAVAFVRAVTTTWYYGTAESREDVTAVAEQRITDYMSREYNVTAKPFRRDGEIVATRIIDEAGEKWTVTVRVVFHSQRPAIYRPTGVVAEFDTYYSVVENVHYGTAGQ